MSAVGGSGRSTTAGLLACALSTMGATAVLDMAPRLASPWPAWSAEPGTGLLSLPPDRPLTRSQVHAAASRFQVPGGGAWHVLTDHQEWNHPPLALPEDPAAWYQLAAIGGWQAVIADTVHPVAHEVLTARCAGSAGLTARWCQLPFSVPVLCAAETGSGVRALQTAVKAASAEGLPLHRMIVVLTAIGEGRSPASVKAAAAMLAPRVGAVIQVPYDPRIRAHGMRDASHLKPRLLEAGRQLAHAVVGSAQAAWGDPLPAAAVPRARTAVPARVDHTVRNASKKVLA
ncbi:hypothetical protein OHB04_27365 [Streptomyces sp. NBC_01775]|uniref:hypothetical protein n=1 Tax=Streptomyces sp. NBC_01775 TaxID=2975939 RepID=UPI002DDBC0A3|nr:hypothetical protein [Streptomyces sp. NBC_01775]WSB79098.1 hypothetical protein OHB04_27365 [Streptomyces sp. NBC_01775]